MRLAKLVWTTHLRLAVLTNAVLVRIHGGTARASLWALGSMHRGCGVWRTKGRASEKLWASAWRILGSIWSIWTSCTIFFAESNRNYFVYVCRHNSDVQVMFSDMILLSD